MHWRGKNHCNTSLYHFWPEERLVFIVLGKRQVIIVLFCFLRARVESNMIEASFPGVHMVDHLTCCHLWSVKLCGFLKHLNLWNLFILEATGWYLTLLFFIQVTFRSPKQTHHLSPPAHICLFSYVFPPWIIYHHAFKSFMLWTDQPRHSFLPNLSKPHCTRAKAVACGWRQ